MLRPARPVEVSLAVQGSRFLAFLTPAADVDAAEAALAARAALHPDATHHCWAWRVWAGGEVAGAGHDAGEPSGTAGRPILGALERADVVDAACVVTRWFGGTKLGTGGLKRAYAGAAAGAVDRAREAGALKAVAPRVVYELAFGYDLTAAVRGAVARFDAREIDADYGEATRLAVSVAPERAGPFEAAIVEATAGGVEARRIGERLEGL